MALNIPATNGVEPSDEMLIKAVQNFCSERVFQRKKLDSERHVDVYRESWLSDLQKLGGPNLSEEKISRLTTKRIQNHVTQIFSFVQAEKAIPNTESNALFDLWNPKSRSAYEVCLGAIKNEFEKDVLKALLDQEVIKLYIFHREYTAGKQNVVYGARWFEHPAQRDVIKLVRTFKLEVIPVPLCPPSGSGKEDRDKG